MYTPSELKERAHALLDERFGAAEAEVNTTFAPGAISILSDQTSYSNGFALLMPLRQGTAVAIRPASGDHARLVFEGSDTEWSLDTSANAPDITSASHPVWAQVVERVVEQYGPANAPVEMAVVSTVPAVCLDGYLAALAVATATGVRTRCPGAHPGSMESHLPRLRQIIAECIGLPYSIAYPIASYAGDPSTFILIDTATREHLPVETEARNALGWSLIDPGGSILREAAFYRTRRDEADEALSILRGDGFEQLTSFRELEHRTLPRAIDAVPERLQPVVRHLVTENRRVQKMVAALRQDDWQMVGALLLMSHASRRDDWKGTGERPDFLVTQIEDMTMGSIYGACMAGRSGYVVIVGQPFAVPPALDELVEAFQKRFDVPPETMVL